MVKMNKIDTCFNELRVAGRTAFIPFISIGDPDIETSFEIAKTLIDNGADIIELGFPFSDPMADGKVIQKSYERALKNRISMQDAFDFAKRLKAYKDIPVILFTYYNPVFVLGIDFAGDAHNAGIDGVLIVDLPPEECGELARHIRKKGIYQIFLLAPTTDALRMKYVLSYAKGFVYYVSVTGVTGARGALPSHLRSRVDDIKKISNIPVGIGFGISSAEQAKEVGRYADAVIIGSKIIRFIENNLNNKKKILSEIAVFASNIRANLT